MYEKGTQVTLKKGSVVRSTNPSKLKYVLTRSQTIKVHCTYPALPPQGYGHPGTPGQVHWAGTGGYWCRTDIANVVEG